MVRLEVRTNIDWLHVQGLALTLPSLTSEFGPSETQVRYTTCATFLGLCIGASFWGIASDVIGRRLAFNGTLFIAGVFGLAVGGGNTWIGTCGLYASLGIGIGGNLPVDGALFLEFLPTASNGLLTLLSIWWPLGQLIASLSKSRRQERRFSKRLTLSQLPGVSFLITRAVTSPRVIFLLLVLPVATKSKTWAGVISTLRWVP